mgnify:FL=1
MESKRFDSLADPIDGKSMLGGVRGFAYFVAGCAGNMYVGAISDESKLGNVVCFPSDEAKLCSDVVSGRARSSCSFAALVFPTSPCACSERESAMAGLSECHLCHRADVEMAKRKFESISARKLKQ